MNFTIVTFATNPKHFVLNILKTKLPIIVLDSSNFDWEGKKATAVQLNFLNTLSDSDLVLCMDCYDILPLNECNYEKLFKQIVNTFNLDKVTFNAETQCFPDESFIEKYPKVESKWKFLNAGIMTGLVKNVKNILNKVISNPIELNQKSYANLFLTTDLIDLDYKCQVFQTLLDGPYPHHPNINFNDFKIDKKTIINKHFNTQPLLFHGNGSVNIEPLLPFVKTISD